MPRFGAVTSSLNTTVEDVVGPTAGATVTIDLTQKANCFAWTAGENETVVTSGTIDDGRLIVLLIANDSTPRTITFGSGFQSSGTLVGVANKISSLVFVGHHNLGGHGQLLYEVGTRLVGLL